VTLLVYRCRLIDEAGANLGPLASKRAGWQAGERLSRWHGEDLVVVTVVATEMPAEVLAYLVVKPR
jgi:hypothetical protein